MGTRLAAGGRREGGRGTTAHRWHTDDWQLTVLLAGIWVSPLLSRLLVQSASSSSSADLSDARFQSLSWRVDAQSHSRHAQEMHQPTAIVQVNTKDAGCRDHQMQFEMDRAQVANVLLEMEKIDAVMNEAASAQ